LVTTVENQNPIITNPASKPPARKLFNAGEPFSIKIISGGDKTCEVRYPTDQELCERTRKQKMVRKNLGRGKSMPMTTKSEHEDARLFEKIRIDTDGPEFDDADAAEVIGRLDLATVQDITRNADGYLVTLKAMRYTTTHTLSVPYRHQVLEHERSSVFRQNDNKLEVLRIALEPSGQLYDTLIKATTGYAEGSRVPINHKFAIIYELLAFVDREMAGDGDDEEEVTDPE